MTKPLEPFLLDKGKLEAELAAFASLLSRKADLSESKDILPFFRANRNLASLMGLYNGKLAIPTLLSNEFSILGDFACDLVVGDAVGHFCFVEFEDAKATSVFKKSKRGIPPWGTRLEQGFSQIVDWFYALDDFRKTSRFSDLFGSGLADYVGLLVVGRSAPLDKAMKDRLCWRSQHAQIDGRPVRIMTFDELHDDLADRVRLVTS